MRMTMMGRMVKMMMTMMGMMMVVLKGFFLGESLATICRGGIDKVNEKDCVKDKEMD